MAEALMVTVTLSVCTAFGLTPITDDDFHNRYLLFKMQNLMGRSELKEAICITHGINYTQLGAKGIEVGIPVIENLTIEKVRDLRDDCREELERFRSELLRLTYEIDSNPWDTKFAREIEKIIESKIRPTLTELRDKLSSLKQKYGISLFDKAVTTSPLPLLLNIFAGLPLEWALPASVGVVCLKQTLDYWQQKTEIKRNGISFLLKLH